MKSAKKPSGQESSGQNNASGQANDGQSTQNDMMALVYPDGRVTKVKLGKK